MKTEIEQNTQTVSYTGSVLFHEILLYIYTHVTCHKIKNAFWWFTIKHLKFYGIAGIGELLSKLLKLCYWI